MSNVKPGAIANDLINETSPYLLQHAYNPVRWMPWGEVAFDRARAENKPVFLSIGYAACHWCHVMERESFENERVAQYLSEHFISIKVDREERPDVDAIYMQAVQMMSGSGGWPLTVFLTPQGKPFFGGTYFPPDNRYGRIGFYALLQRIQEVWVGQAEQVATTGDQLTRAIAGSEHPETMPGELSPDILTRATLDLAQRYDVSYGGFGGAPKFPPSMALNVLLSEWKRTGDARQLQMAERTLQAMARGGMYDQLGGGFHRYSTDPVWLVPHFEKMLYDNALLAQVYFDAAIATGDADYERVGRETLDYVLRDLTSPQGGFYSSQDADSEGVEGKFYTWTPEDVKSVLGETDGALFCDYYGVVPHGNWAEGEGASILHVDTPLTEFAARAALDTDALRGRLDAMRGKLLKVRSKRIAPGTDDKVLTAWNGMMISAMARGAQVTGEARYAQAARRAVDFILSRLYSQDAAGDANSLLHTWSAGREGRGERAHISAFLEDYAQLIQGLIDLYETTGDAQLLVVAERLATQMLNLFYDRERGGFYATDGRDASLIARQKEFYDGATPSGNSTAVLALLRLGMLFGREDFLTAAREALKLMAGQMMRAPGAYHEMIRGAALEMNGATEVVIVLPEENSNTSGELNAILNKLHRTYVPQRLIAVGKTDSKLALIKDRPAIDGKLTIYVCCNHTCSQPVHGAEAMMELLATSH